MQKKLLSALGRYPVFTVREIAGVLGKSRSYAYLVAYRLKKSGIIHEIEKGKYAVEEDPFIVASWIAWPSYITGWAALNYHKMTEQLPFAIQVATTQKRKRASLSYGNARIEFIKIKNEAFCGFRKEQYGGKEIFIAEKEKALADALAARKMSFSEAGHILRENRGKISVAKLLRHAALWKGLKKKVKVALDDTERGND